LAWNRVLLAERLTAAGRASEAGPHLESALRALEDLTRAEPENLRWRQGLARAWEATGRMQASSGQSDESRGSARKAVAIARELARAEPVYTYDLACSLGLLGRLSPSRADEDEAVATLRRAMEAGFDDVHRLRTDPRLDHLPSRPDFPAPPRTPGRPRGD
jgi:tetratricopeptide (TPR) repeat protein